MNYIMLIGLVGKPSSGKSTFFKAATLAEVLIASYPFATIKPNHGVGYVKIDCIDKEFKVQCQPRTGYCKNGIRFVPVEIMDVAGLIEGSSEGKGLGNQFLSDLTAADAFIQVVDISGETDSEGKETKDYNPVKDVKMLENELDLWFLGILKKVWKTFAKTVQTTKSDFSKAVAEQFSGLKVDEIDVKNVIRKGNYNSEKPSEWDDVELMKFAHDLRHISKPMIIAANKCDRPEARSNLNKLKKEYPDLMIVACSADSELALREAGKGELIEYLPGNEDFQMNEGLNDKQKEALESIKKNVLDVYGSTGVQEVLNKLVFELLNQIAVFPAGDKMKDSKGNILPDCFLLKEGSTAYNFAETVHSDLAKNFIKAIDVRTKQAVGKDHKLKHRDGLEIITR
jgi:ribosome-binding ATPase